MRRTIRTMTLPIRHVNGAQPLRAGGVQAVERACLLLGEVIRSPSPLSVGELSRRTGLHQSTTSRLLVSLQRSGFVEREGTRGPVRLSDDIAGRMLNRSMRETLVIASQPLLVEIGRATTETVNLSVPTGDGLVDNIAQVDAPHLLGTTNWVGRFVPAHCSSAGKVFLAFGVATLPPGPLERFTAATITDRRTLEKELEDVRRRGYAVMADELELGLRAVAAPVRDGNGRVVATLAVSGPSVRLPRRRLREFADVLSRRAEVLGQRLGTTTGDSRESSLAASSGHEKKARRS